MWNIILLLVIYLKFIIGNIGVANTRCVEKWESCGRNLTQEDCLNRECCYIVDSNNIDGNKCFKRPDPENDYDYLEDEEGSGIIEPIPQVPYPVRFSIRKLRQYNKSSIEEAYNATKIIQKHLQARAKKCMNERCSMERKNIFSAIMKTTLSGVLKPITMKSGTTIQVDPNSIPQNISKGIFVEYPTLTRIIQKNLEEERGNFSGNKCNESEVFIDELPVISITVYTDDWKKVSVPVNFTMSKVNETSYVPSDQNRKTRVSCKYLDEIDYIWSDNGCNIIADVESKVTCQCNHTTKFSILFVVAPLNITFNENDLSNIKILEYVMQSLSVICLLTTFGVLVLVQKRRTRSVTSVRASERTAVHCNFVVALACLHVTRLTTDIAIRIPDLCVTTVVLSHYFMLASGTWMLIEGVLLYISVILRSMTSVKLGYNKFIVGWGVPALISAFTVGIGMSKKSYVHENKNSTIVDCDGVKHYKVGEMPYEHCWLSIENGIIWAATGPLIVIFAINLFILGHTVIFILILSRKTDTMLPAGHRNNNHLHFWNTAKGILILFPILGVPWLIGFLANIQVAQANILFQYIHVILNGLQGVFIFVLYCIVSKEARSIVYRVVNQSWEKHKVSVSASNTLPRSHNYSLNSLKRNRRKTSQKDDTQGKITPNSGKNSNASQFSAYTPSSRRKQNSFTSCSTASTVRNWNQMNSLDRIHTRAQYSAMMHPGSSVSLPRTWHRKGNKIQRADSLSSLAVQPPVSRNSSTVNHICKECDPLGKKRCNHGKQQVAGYYPESDTNGVQLTGFEYLDMATQGTSVTTCHDRWPCRMTAEEFKRFSAIPEEKRRSEILSIALDNLNCTDGCQNEIENIEEVTEEVVTSSEVKDIQSVIKLRKTKSTEILERSLVE